MSTAIATPERPIHGDLDRVVDAACRLDAWGIARGWRGFDPYDALNAPITGRLRRSPLALRVLIQVTKRSPLNLRPLLGVAPALSSATLAHLLRAYSANGFLSSETACARLAWCLGELERLRVDGYAEACWSYHFDVQTRVFFYPRTAPNTIATAFAGLGLLDAYEFTGDERALELALSAGEFFVRHVPQTRAGDGAYFGYLPGDATPIHNANMLVCALLARLASIAGRADLAEKAAGGVRYTLARQRADGSWPYGEQPGLTWVDGFHTGYVLDCLLTCLECGVGGDGAEPAWRRGLRYYVETLLTHRAEPKYTPASVFPIDGQCAAQAIETLSRAAKLEPELAERRWSVASYALKRLRRRDGAFIFQRRRFWTNRTAHPRWVQAPMLAAFAQLVSTTR